jgi:hypothetical protein
MTRWTPADVVNIFKEQETPIRMVFDLTNGYNYYDPQEFEAQGVFVVKVGAWGSAQREGLPNR